MPSDTTKLPRITVSLDHFDEAVINMMAENMGKSRSEILRNIVNEWILANSKSLKSKYGIIFEDVQREIQFKNEERNLEDDLKQILRFFKRAKSIDIDRLAEKLVMSSKTLLDLLDEHGDELENRGLNLQIEGNLIVKL